MSRWTNWLSCRCVKPEIWSSNPILDTKIFLSIFVIYMNTFLWRTRNRKRHGGPGARRLAFHGQGKNWKSENQSWIGFQHLAQHFEHDKDLCPLGSTTVHIHSKILPNWSSSRNIAAMSAQPDDFFRCLITMDECWVYPMTPRQRRKARMESCGFTTAENGKHPTIIGQGDAECFLGTAMAWC